MNKITQKQYAKGTSLKDLREASLPACTTKTTTVDQYEKHLIGEILYMLNKLQKDKSFLEVLRLARNLRKFNKEEIENREEQS